VAKGEEEELGLLKGKRVEVYGPKQHWGVWTPNKRDEGQTERTRVSKRGVGGGEGKRERSGRVKERAER